MPCGLFGKLPAKRDFIALNAPSDFLAVYEKWLQGGLTASRLELGNRWQEAYLNAPIWRFWLGGAHGGQTVAGAFMPSVDGVGRYFPLTVFAAASPGADRGRYTLKKAPTRVAPRPTAASRRRRSICPRLA